DDRRQELRDPPPGHRAGVRDRPAGAGPAGRFRRRLPRPPRRARPGRVHLRRLRVPPQGRRHALPPRPRPGRRRPDLSPENPSTAHGGAAPSTPIPEPAPMPTTLTFAPATDPRDPFLYATTADGRRYRVLLSTAGYVLSPEPTAATAHLRKIRV